MQFQNSQVRTKKHYKKKLMQEEMMHSLELLKEN